MTLKNAAPVDFTCEFSTAQPRALFSGELTHLLMYGAVAAWTFLMDNHADEVLDAIEAGEVVRLSQRLAEASLLPFEFEKSAQPGNVLVFICVSVQDPVSAGLVGVIHKELTGPNAHRWAISPASMEERQAEGLIEPPLDKDRRV